MPALQTVFVASIGLTIVYLATVAAAAILSALRIGGRLDDRVDDSELVAASRFSIPVTVVVPVSGELPSLDATIRSLLGFNYSEFEVIVVADNLSPTSLAALTTAWQLEAKEFFYRRALDTSAVRRIYRSAADARLMIIDKSPGGLADALNCGLNLARYRYVLTLASEVAFDANALLRIMAPASRDPSTVVGVANHVERVPQALLNPVNAGGLAKPSRRVGFVERFQQLGSLRAMMQSRLVWKSLRRGLGPDDNVVVWRRDAVLKAGGFSAKAADPIAELMFRVQTTRTDRSERIVRTAAVFGRIGTASAAAALAAAARQQRATTGIFWLICSGTERAFGTTAALAVIGLDVLTPLAAAWLIAGTAIGATVGWFHWSVALFAIVALVFGHAAVSTAALLLRGSAPFPPEEAELKGLLTASVIESVVWTPLRTMARLGGLVTAKPASAESRVRVRAAAR